MLLASYFTPLTLANEPAKALPSAEFLTFLAELQQVDGKWLSPLDLPAQSPEQPPTPKEPHRPTTASEKNLTTAPKAEPTP